MSADIAKTQIAIVEGSVSDYATVANFEMQKQRSRNLQKQIKQSQTALRNVNSRLLQLGTNRPPQQYGDPSHRRTQGKGSSSSSSMSNGCCGGVSGGNQDQYKSQQKNQRQRQTATQYKRKSK